MRHDPAAGAIVIMLRSLKMYGMAQAVTDLIEQGAPAVRVDARKKSPLGGECIENIGRWRVAYVSHGGIANTRKHLAYWRNDSYQFATRKGA